jgi:hypothetical protein
MKLLSEVPDSRAAFLAFTKTSSSRISVVLTTQNIRMYDNMSSIEEKELA